MNKLNQLINSFLKSYPSSDLLDEHRNPVCLQISKTVQKLSARIEKIKIQILRIIKFFQDMSQSDQYSENADECHKTEHAKKALLAIRILVLNELENIQSIMEPYRANKVMEDLQCLGIYSFDVYDAIIRAYMDNLWYTNTSTYIPTYISQTDVKCITTHGDIEKILIEIDKYRLEILNLYKVLSNLYKDTENFYKDPENCDVDHDKSKAIVDRSRRFQFVINVLRWFIAQITILMKSSDDYKKEMDKTNKIATDCKNRISDLLSLTSKRPQYSNIPTSEANNIRKEYVPPFSTEQELIRL